MEKGVHVLINQTTREPLACRIIRCDTFGRRLRGLMFRRRLLSDEAYLFVFEKCIVPLRVGRGVGVGYHLALSENVRPVNHGMPVCG